MDLVVNEEFTKMYSEEELLGARRIQVRRKTGDHFRRRVSVLSMSCGHFFPADSTEMIHARCSKRSKGADTIIVCGLIA